MKLLWIGVEANKPAEAAFTLPLQRVPSLVALAMAEKPQYDAVLLDCRPGLAYSLPHILAAAQRFKRQNIFFGVVTAPELQNELKTRNVAAEATPEPLLKQLSASKKTKTVPVHGLTLPPKKKIQIDVYGTQSRIGCTTQTFRICRYLASLGLSPAVWLEEDQKMALAPLFETDGAIRGLPVTTQELPPGCNCLIRDCGVFSGSGAADVNILVGGIKLWELPATVAALTRFAEQPHPIVIVSFGVEGQSAVLRRICPAATIIDAPWQPDPFSEEVTDYSALLPCLQEIIKISE